MNPVLNPRDDRIIGSIINPDSMLLGPAKPSENALDLLAERLRKNINELTSESVSKALYYVSRSSRPELSASVLIPIVSNPDINKRNRCEAINALGELPSKFADEPLAALLKDGESVSEQVVLKAMAQTGGSASLRVLQSMASSEDEQISTMRAFAETMISLRLNKKPSRNAELQILPRATAFKLKPATNKALKQTINSIEGLPSEMKLNAELGFTYECGTSKHTILFDAQIKRGEYVRSLSAAKIVGVIVMSKGGNGRNVVRHLIVVAPDKTSTRISVVRSDGVVSMSGEIKPEGKGLRLFLRDLGAETVPIQINGLITERDIELNADAFQSVRKTRKTGIPINS